MPMTFRKLYFVVVAALLVIGCGGDGGPDGAIDGAIDGGADAGTEPGCGLAGTCEANPALIIGGTERPAEVRLPDDYDAAKAYPLVFLFHGFRATGPVQRAYFFGALEALTEDQFILVAPTGTLDEEDRTFWNATPACCNFFDSEVDDVAYARLLVEEARDTYNIDNKRVYAMGHSNGGFMSYRLACEASDLFTAIASFAGSTFLTDEECTPRERPVSVLQVHGTDDGTISIDGNSLGYPSASDTVIRHAGYLGCDTDAAVALPSLDLWDEVDGNETDVLAYTEGCGDGLNAELWTINDGTHILFGIPNLAPSIVRWLLTHSR